VESDWFDTICMVTQQGIPALAIGAGEVTMQASYQGPHPRGCRPLGGCRLWQGDAVYDPSPLPMRPDWVGCKGQGCDMPECAHPCAAAWAGASARSVSSGWPVLHRIVKLIKANEKNHMFANFALLIWHAAS